MIGTLKATPDNWSMVLRPKGSNVIDPLRSTLELLWTAQLDRHGTDDERVPLDVSPDEAEAALHLATTITHWFRQGFVKTV